MDTSLYSINPKTMAMTFLESGNRSEMGREMSLRSRKGGDKYATYETKSGKLISSTASGGAAVIKNYMKYNIPGMPRLYPVGY